MKNLMKVLCLVLVLVMVVAPVASFANFGFNDVTATDNLGVTGTIQNVGNSIYAILRTVAIIVAVCMMAYMAINWLLATPAKKAELKGRMIYMAIGVVLLVGGVAILNFLESAVVKLPLNG